MTQSGQEAPGALITGATGPIGAALVRAFAAEGYFVGIHYHTNQARAQELLEEVETRSGAGMTLPGDLRDAGRGQAVFQEFCAQSATPAVLVNNAGRSLNQLFLFIQPDDWQEALASNLHTLYGISRAAVRTFIARRQGSIINISSLSGLKGLPGQTHYAAAKSAVHGFTRALAREVGRYGIRVNAIAPGAIESPAVDAISQKHRQRLEEAACLGRCGTPEEVAGVATFLASSKASFITGQVLAVDGGIT